MSTANRTLTASDFVLFFQELWGREPYDWQQRLAEQVLQSADDGWPAAIVLPTAAGKTACVDIAVFAIAALADMERKTTPHPRRLFYTVDRRNIVDQTFQRATDLKEKLAYAQDGILSWVADRLRRLAGCDAPEPLAVYRLRGGIRQSSSWERNPRQPAVITTTVDQVGSALLFRAYGKGHGAWPVHAGLAANDSIIILDEAHCAQPFLQTVRAIRKYRQWAETPPHTPFQAVIMSATPPGEITQGEIFSDTSSQQADPSHSLGCRQLAAKPARLAEAKRVTRNGNTLNALGQELAAAALDLAGPNIPTVVVFANRVATAREAYRIIRERDLADAVLVTGRMRQQEREQAMRILKRVAPDADPQTRAGARPLIAVATQTLEIGADLDFDGLVTECASLDALRQRFGRLNRVGRDIAAPGRIIIRADQVKEGTHDPIYGEAISATWQWLNEQANAAGQIDFSIANIAALLRDMPADDRERLHPPAANATVMLPAHLDAWAQTGPEPETWPAPSLDTYLHGKDDRPADVQVCWRAGLDLGNTAEVDDILRACPPNSQETLPVPLYAFHRWLAGAAGDDNSGDAPGLESDTARTDGPGEDSRRVIRWRGQQTGRERSDITTTANPGDIEPGDTVVIPTGHPGDFRCLGDLPNYAPGGPATLDIGDETNCKARGRPTLRISHELLQSWQRVVADAAPEAQDALQTVRDSLAEISQTDLTAAERAAAVEGLLQRLDELDETEIPAGYEFLSNNASLLRGKAGFRVVSSRANTLVLQPRRPVPVVSRSGNDPDEHPDDENDIVHSRRANTVLLTCHSHGVADWAKRYAAGCGITGPELAAIRCAALLHDIGKADPLFQQAMHGGNPYYDPTRPLAKSPNAAGISVRHELMSVRMAESSPGLLPDDPDARDLALHLIASHHGHCRPFAPHRPADLEKRATEFILDGVAMHGQGPTKLERLDSGVTERYWRLTRKYGWWGLAYLEAIVRVADWSRSQWEETHND